MTMAVADLLAIEGTDALRDEELLGLIVGNHGKLDPTEIASKLLDKFHDLSGLARAALPELRREGLGPAAARRVQAALRLAQRLGERPLNRGEPIRSGSDVAARYGAQFAHRRREHLLLLMLDARNRVIGEHIVSAGSMTASLVHPREVLEPLVREGAAAFIVAHNHPSGDPTPSADDVAITKRLRELAELVGIRLVDHVVVGREGFVSMASAGWGWRPKVDRAAEGPRSAREAR